ncbi:RNA-binding domain-containing protein [Megasphaera elsdenii]|uniref:AAA family ATPase n=1 Tax=Megasphaera elsdenii TaxID=907 RepID=A0A848EVI6_MEGEL|nr:AAA family ATPase [Megasphaera elsdenii]
MPIDEMNSMKQALIHMRESNDIELKKAKKGLPESFWESYSSFANTTGGLIVFGVNEAFPDNEIVGVEDSQKIVADLWNLLSNESKVSYRTVNNQDVTTVVVDDKTVILIKVNEAPNNVKPVYINGKIDNTWIRTGDGDRKAKKEEIASMLRNAKPEMDSLPIDGCTLDDLDIDSIKQFKQQVGNRYPAKKYLDMSDTDFLIEIGACRLNRENRKYQILRGTLLFFGKLNVIKEFYPHFHLDFFNRRGSNPRWIDRVSDDEPHEHEMNIFNFFNIVDKKLRELQNSSFHLDGQLKRIPEGTFNETIRECLVNCLAHADYEQGYPSIKIQAYDGWFSFFNPGEMLISRMQFPLGGDSRPRNEIIMKMFRLLGAAERQGFGGPLIFKTAFEYDYRRPELDTNLESTEIRVWNIDLADSYPELSKEEKSVLRYLHKSMSAISIKELSKKTNMTYYRAKKIIYSLKARNIIEQIGSGPSTKYVIKAGSEESLTQIQIAMDMIKRQLTK